MRQLIDLQEKKKREKKKNLWYWLCGDPVPKASPKAPVVYGTGT